MQKDGRVLAIDLGASSGRGIVYEYKDGRLQERTVHRFSNGAKEENSRLVWDINMLYDEICNAIKIANLECGKLDGVGIDTWGVDFGLIGSDGNIMGNPRNYRDSQNAVMREKLKDREWEFYQISGISANDFNTTYQLAVRNKEKTDWEKVKYLLFMPQLVGYLLTGKAATEPTIASTSGFFNIEKGFDKEFLKEFEIPSRIFPEVKKTGEILGVLKKEVANRVGVDYDLPVILTAGHDTACAVLGVPSEEEYPLYLSSGTWSLFGTLTDKPINTRQAFENAYTNELAFDGKVRLLKNIIGMWIIQECRRQWQNQGQELSYSEIVELAKSSKPTGAYIDVNASEFAQPCDMADRVKEYVQRNQGITLASIGEIADCVYRSMAKSHKDAYEDLCMLTGKHYDRLYIIGGGANNGYLNQLIANQLGISVWAGPGEASALGNALGQFVGLGILKKEQIKDIIMANYEVKIFEPYK